MIVQGRDELHITGNAATDIATIAAFDPGAAAELIRNPAHKAIDLDAAVADGRLTTIDVGGDGEFDFSLFVNEPVPGAIAEHVTATADGFLHVPGGVLFVTGAEDLQVPEPPGDAVESFSAPLGDRFEIPPGWYAARVLAVDWGEKDDERSAALIARLPEHQQQALKSSETSCLVGIALIVLGIAAIIIGVVIDIFTSGFSFWWVIIAVLATWAAMYAWIVLSPRYRRMVKAGEAYQLLLAEHRRAHPTLVLHLESINADALPQPSCGCRLTV